MLADPQTVTIDAVATSLPLVRTKEQERTYASADGTLQLLTRQQVTKDGFRREIRLTPTIVATDPLSTEQDYQTCSVYLVIAEPRVGFTDEQMGDYVEALKDWLTEATVLKILAGEM